MVRRDREIGVGTRGGDHVEVREGGLHHDDVRPLVDVRADLCERFATVARVLLVALAVAAAHDRDVDGIAERAVERRGVLGGVGEDGGARVAGGVEGGADRRDLPIHHPARRGDVGAGVGLRPRRPRVELEGGVVVDVTVGTDDAAVAVVGVLVDAQVGDQHHLVSDLGPQVGERQLHDAVGIPSP